MKQNILIRTSSAFHHDSKRATIQNQSSTAIRDCDLPFTIGGAKQDLKNGPGSALM